jgi:hypothetical protein
MANYGEFRGKFMAIRGGLPWNFPLVKFRAAPSSNKKENMIDCKHGKAYP